MCSWCREKLPLPPAALLPTCLVLTSLEEARGHVGTEWRSADTCSDLQDIIGTEGHRGAVPERRTEASGRPHPNHKAQGGSW